MVQNDMNRAEYLAWMEKLFGPCSLKQARLMEETYDGIQEAFGYRLQIFGSPVKRGDLVRLSRWRWVWVYRPESVPSEAWVVDLQWYDNVPLEIKRWIIRGWRRLKL